MNIYESGDSAQSGRMPLTDPVLLVRPDIGALLASPPPGPEGFTLALLAHLRETGQFLSNASDADIPEPETLTWMLMELTSNAVSSALGSVLGRLTGLSRARMLNVFGTSVIWPGEADIWHPSAPEEDILKVEEALGMKSCEWLGLPALDKFESLGLLPGDGWVAVRAAIDRERGSFAVSVVSEHPPLYGDLTTIRQLFSDPDRTRNEVIGLRKTHTDSGGMHHIPSFSGGGGLGLLECMRIAAENDLVLDWKPPEAERGPIVFMLGRNLDNSI